MTRCEALRKLLALGGMTREEIVQCTHWPEADVDAALASLRATGQLGVHRLLSGNGPAMFFVGPDPTPGKNIRGASGRAIANARRSSFLPCGT